MHIKHQSLRAIYRPGLVAVFALSFIALTGCFDSSSSSSGSSDNGNGNDTGNGNGNNNGSQDPAIDWASVSLDSGQSAPMTLLAINGLDDLDTTEIYATYTVSAGEVDGVDASDGRAHPAGHATRRRAPPCGPPA